MKKILNHEYEDSKTRGPVGDNQMEIDSFSALKISGNVKVVYAQGDTCQLTFHGNEKDLQQYAVKVKDGCLRVSLKDGSTSVNSDTPRLTAIITSPSMEKVVVTGACCMEIPDTFVQDSSLEFDVSGMASLVANHIEVQKFDLDVSGAANMKIESLTAREEIELDMSGACNMQASFQSPEVDVNMSGAGNADLSVECDKLEADVSGTGNLVLGGKCGRLLVDTSGMSNLNTRNLEVTEK
ncbi:MAG: GIN domain-containing protein [Bacteroidaceae bacterium]